MVIHVYTKGLRAAGENKVYGLQFKNIGIENQESASTSRVSYSKAEQRNNSLILHRLQNKKRSPQMELLKKIGGDLLFHKQVQYHRRCGA